MPNTRSIYRRHRKRPARADGVDPVARQYERGREAPFSPRSPENSQGTPAVEEAERRAEAGNVSRMRDNPEEEDPATQARPAHRRKPSRPLH